MNDGLLIGEVGCNVEQVLTVKFTTSPSTRQYLLRVIKLFELLIT
jgi:hypothetical protein